MGRTVLAPAFSTSTTASMVITTMPSMADKTTNNHKAHKITLGRSVEDDLSTPSRHFSWEIRSGTRDVPGFLRVSQSFQGHKQLCLTTRTTYHNSVPEHSLPPLNSYSITTFWLHQEPHWQILRVPKFSKYLWGLCHRGIPWWKTTGLAYFSSSSGWLYFPSTIRWSKYCRQISP